MDIKKYRELGIQLTPQRYAILDYLSGNKGHPSAENIYKAVSRKFPAMSFATVYNTLETLRDKGNVTELTIDPGRKRYDPNIKPHHHLICVECKSIVDIQKEFKLSISNNMIEGFDLIGSHIEFYGICPDCKK